MRSLKSRLTRLERRDRRVPVLILRDELFPDDRQAALEEYRRAHRLSPNAPVIVITPEEARL